MNSYNFLQLQHPILKLIFACVSLLFAGLVKSLVLLFSLLVILILLSSCQKFILTWLRAIARLSPLFISIIISGFIFSIPFPNQLELCLRIVFLLTVSLFVFITIPAEFLTTLVNKNSHGITHDIAKFLWKTSQLIPHFFTSFKNEYNQHKPDFVKAIVLSFTKAHQTDQEEIVLPNSQVSLPPLYNWANLLLAILILAEIGFIIRSFI